MEKQYLQDDRDINNEHKKQLFRTAGKYEYATHIGQEHTGDFVMFFCSTTVAQQNLPCVLTVAWLCSFSAHTKDSTMRLSYCKIARQSHPCVSGHTCTNQNTFFDWYHPNSQVHLMPITLGYTQNTNTQSNEDLY